MFEEAGMAALREKSVALTGYLQELIDARLGGVITVITPRPPEQRGCHLSMRVNAGRESARSIFKGLQDAGFLGDWREPDIIRLAPVPLYNTFDEVWRTVDFIASRR
jgi:kynureninase